MLEEQISKPMASKIEAWEISRLIRNARNARTHSDKQIQELAGSIQAFGFIVPVLVDHAGIILAGHARVLAAQKLGLPRVPVIVVDHLDEKQKRAYAIADNKIALNAGWNDEVLRVELEQLKKDGMELPLVGFSQDEFNALLDKLHSEDKDEDEVPEAEEDAISRSGDLWVMGDHRLLCGDALDPASYQALLAGETADMAFLDPPYNVAYLAPGLKVEIANDDLGPQFGAFLQKACENVLQNIRGAAYICMSSSELHTLYNAFTQAGGHWSTFLIWGKNTFTLGRSDYMRQFECILYGWRKGQKHYWCGARDQGDLWMIDKPHVNDLHPTMKPVALVERAVMNSSRRGEKVLDSFAGSGSTLIACEKTGRLARVMELEPRYCDVIVKRWRDLTGHEAELENGGPFSQIAEQRRISVES